MATAQQAPDGMPADAAAAARETLGELVSSASEDLSSLVRAEIALAKTELRTEAKNAALGSALFGAGGFLGIMALVLLSFAAAYGLVAAGLPRGFAFLILGGAYLIVGLLAALIGFLRFRKIGPPRYTMTSAKKTAEWARHPRVAE